MVQFYHVADQFENTFTLSYNSDTSSSSTQHVLGSWGLDYVHAKNKFLFPTLAAVCFFGDGEWGFGCTETSKTSLESVCLMELLYFIY